MKAPTPAPCGSWSSPVTAENVAAGAVRLGSVTLDQESIYWVEGRPREAGRNVLVRWNRGDGVNDVTPAGVDVRTRVHEYGGAAYVASGGSIYYSEFSDGRVYALSGNGSSRPLTAPADCYYADFAVDPARRRLVCVREDHSAAGREPVNTLVALSLDGNDAAGDVLVSGYNFYAFPRFNSDGSRLAWICWRHPQMPWDGTELWIADVSREGALSHAHLVVGGEDEAIFQPGWWSPDDTLYFVSDRRGWWNLYRLHGHTIELVHAMDADMGRPLWQLGMSTWAFSGASRVVVSYQQLGRWRLGIIDLHTGAFARVATDREPGENLTATATHAVCAGGSDTEVEAIVRIELATGRVERIRAASDISINPAYLSAPRPIEVPTETYPAHAFYYAPRNPDFIPLPGERPPLIVISHGGPTASTSARLNLEVQYWTSRGFAVVDVNYRGSSGYGRAYRRRLDGQWGVRDVDDCVAAARHLVSEGNADPDRLIIRGRSAGGYTTLAALTFRPGVFKAGASYYGVSDLEAMAHDTHKFESRYLDRLIGPYPAVIDRYRARSPIWFVDRLSCPMIFFQGLDDRIVPPSQSEMMANSLREKGLPVTILTFEGEQHGFRRAETIVRCLEAELAFYGAVFGFSPGSAPSLVRAGRRSKI